MKRNPERRVTAQGHRGTTKVVYAFQQYTVQARVMKAEMILCISAYFYLPNTASGWFLRLQS